MNPRDVPIGTVLACESRNQIEYTRIVGRAPYEAFARPWDERVRLEREHGLDYHVLRVLVKKDNAPNYVYDVFMVREYIHTWQLCIPPISRLVSADEWEDVKKRVHTIIES